MKLPPLEALRYFEVVARHLSFTSAADELCISQSAVSQKISLLEQRLGYKLFYRKPRQLTLSKEGCELQRHVILAFDQLQQAMQHISSIQQLRAIDLYCMPSMASCWLMPYLQDLYNSNPDISLNLIVDTGEPQFREESMDLALCHGYGDGPNMLKQFLFQDYIYPVVSNALFLKYDGDPDRCLQHIPLLHDSLPQAKLSTSWRQWAAQHDKHIDIQAGYRYNRADLIMQAAIDGQGLALARHVLAAREVAEGRLVPLYPDVVQDQSVYLVCRKNLLEKEHVVQFVDWISAKAKAFEQDYAISRLIEG